MKIRSIAYARAGLLGNPSDGYFGKIIAISVKNFSARVSLEESDKLQIKPPKYDRDQFRDINDLSNKIDLYGYYGGSRLIKAAIKKFHEYCLIQNITLDSRNFTLRYESNIPRQLGLGGSSAIITAVFKALMEFYHVKIPIHILPTLILHAELQELGINAGYMDRVIQVYEGCVYMDLNQDMIEQKSYGIYERMDPKLLPSLYLAYKPELGKVSGKVLNDIRTSWENKEPEVLKILERIAEIASQGKKSLYDQDFKKFFALMNENFDLRSHIMQITKSNFELIQTARRFGVSAKFAGSGGSIIGMYTQEEVFNKLKMELKKLGAITIIPIIG